MARGNTWVNALVGAAVTVLTVYVPFSPVAGGAVAGYLQGEDLRDGATVGALSGLLAAIPFGLLVTLAAAVFVIVPPGGSAAELFAVVFVAALVAASLYTVGFGAIGGVVGAYVVRERRRNRLDPATPQRRPRHTSGEWEEYEATVSPRDRDDFDRR